LVGRAAFERRGFGRHFEGFSRSSFRIALVGDLVDGLSSELLPMLTSGRRRFGDEVGRRLVSVAFVIARAIESV
jgi:hypothetical protein